MLTKHENRDIGGGLLPLCVDLDGTLTRVNTLVESLILCIRDWQLLMQIPVWILQGKAAFKANLARHVKIDPAILPYNDDLLQYLRDQKDNGRYLVLATAANQLTANEVSKHLGIFDEVIASDGTQNLRGEEKGRALVERFGRRFCYVGNDQSDLYVWKLASSGILVNTSPGTAKRAAKATRIEKHFNDNAPWEKALFIALRPHQWVKNLLAFVPIVTSKAFGDLHSILNTFITFLAFCFVASAIYIINDILDIQADRQHPNKRHRPFASGALSPGAGLSIVPVLLILGGAFAVFTRVPAVLLLLSLYAVTSIAYSMTVKKIPLLDVFTLAALYSTRLFAGGESSGYRVSLWLLAFSGFLFLSLSILKRVGELKATLILQKTHLCGRGYSTEDLNVMQTFGIASTFISSMVLALYIQSQTAAMLYPNPNMLWILVPCILFWQCHLWLSTSRGQMADDPIVYTAKDPVSWLVGLLISASLFFANVTF